MDANLSRSSTVLYSEDSRRSEQRKICGFKNNRICVDKALVILPFENELNFYRKNCKCSKCYTFASYSWSTRN